MEITQVEKDKLIELFASYYGEQYKDYITQKINNTTFITVSSLLSKRKKLSVDMFSVSKTSDDQYGEIDKAIYNLQRKQDLEISNLESDNISKLFNELTKVYPKLSDVKLNFEQTQTIKKILKFCSNSEFYTKDILEFFDQLDIKFESLEDFKQCEISNLLMKYSTGRAIAEISEKYKDQITKVDILYQESVSKLESIPNIKKESLDCLVDCVWNFSSTNRAQACCTTYLTNDNEMHEIVVLSENFNEHQLIHELNHAIELHFIKHTDNGYMFISGFDKLQTTFNNIREIDNKGKIYRKNELLNEAINEFITLGIMDKAKELQINISDNNDSGSGYAAGVSLAYKFISTYKQEMIDCRLSDNPLSFADIIGVENFDEISRLIGVFMTYKDIRLVDAMGSLEYKSGKSFKGLSDFIDKAEELLKLDLTESEKVLLESICEYNKLSEKLIAEKQNSLIN